MTGIPQTQEEIRAAVEARAAEIEGTAETGTAPQPRRPLQVDLSQFSGTRYLREYPPAFDWLLDKSFRLNCLGAIVGPPGAGKGSLAIQLCVAVASGTSLVDAWQTAAPEPVVYLSAEDDALTIHRRVHHALEQLPEDLREQAAANFYGIPVHGGVNLCRAIGGTVESTANYEDLRNILDAIRPRLLVLDTLARFSGVDENDNPAMTAFCGLLEGLIDAYGCNIILLHHSNKTSGDLIEDPKELAKALTQTAMRGASALAGCIRWGMLVAPLGAALAQKRIGESAIGKYDGAFLAVRVGKKNSGGPEPRYYLGRNEHGLLYRVDPDARQEENDVVWDAHQLAEEVERRQRAGEKPLSVSRGGQEAFGWGVSRSRKAREKAVELGLLIEMDLPGRKAKHLYPPAQCSDVPQCSTLVGTLD